MVFDVQYGCIGDSGGPFMQLDDPLGHYEKGDPSLDLVVGITSFGVGEAQREKASIPGVYTSVSFFRKWIDCVTEGKIPKVTTLYFCSVVKKNHTRVLTVLMYTSVQRKCGVISFRRKKSVDPSPSLLSPPSRRPSPPPSPVPCLNVKKSEKGFNEKDALKVNTISWNNATRISLVENDEGY